MLALWALCSPAQQRLAVPLGLDSFIPTPEQNPLTPEKAALGRRLFFDKELSRDFTVACATCHDPQRAFTDGRPLAVGIESRTGLRRTPPILNRAWGRSFFWDGRAGSLEEQVLQPILNPKEMDLTPALLEQRLRARGVTVQEAALALAAYVRTILAGDSPYDRYVAGDRAALNESARLGLRLFRGKAGCATCHVGPNLTDERFHNTGLGWKEGRFSDRGRAEVSHRDEDLGAFKTPSLREVARTAPYMHDGSLATLDDVIEFYDQGGRANPSLDPDIRKLGLTGAEKRALAEFLRALTGTVREGWPVAAPGQSAR